MRKQKIEFYDWDVILNVILDVIFEMKKLNMFLRLAFGMNTLLSWIPPIVLPHPNQTIKTEEKWIVWKFLLMFFLLFFIRWKFDKSKNRNLLSHFLDLTE